MATKKNVFSEQHKQTREFENRVRDLWNQEFPWDPQDRISLDLSFAMNCVRASNKSVSDDQNSSSAPGVSGVRRQVASSDVQGHLMDFDPQPGTLFEYKQEIRLHLVRGLIHVDTGDFVVFLKSQSGCSKIYLIKQSRNVWITTENLRLGFTAHLTK